MSAPRMLGRLPHDPDRPVLRLGHYLAGQVPKHPIYVDYLTQVHDWGVWGNDLYGDCGPVSVGNQRKQVSLYLGGQEQSPSLDDIFALYRTQNPTFDPATGAAGDNGVVLADMLSALLKVGVAGVKPLAYASVDVTNPDEVRAAISLFGSVLFGVDLDVAQQAQTDTGVWDYQRRSPEWGGHAVMAGAYTSDTSKGAVDISVISWGERIGVTDEFCARQLQEAWVVLWPEVLGTAEFEQGVDLSALAADYEQLTGRKFPAIEPEPTPGPPAPAPAPQPQPEPPAPAPSPEPVPDPDGEFRAKLAAFIGDAQTWLGQ